MINGDWLQEVKKLDSSQVKRLRTSLAELEKWPTFAEQFQGTGIFAIAAIVEDEHTNRIAGRRKIVEKLTPASDTDCF